MGRDTIEESMAARRRADSRWLWVPVFLVSAFLFGLVRWSERPLLRNLNGQCVLADTDPYVRMYLVREALHTGSPRIRHVTCDNAPYGRLNEWTTPTTWIGWWLARAARSAGQSEEEALRWAGLLLAPLVGFVLLAVAAYLGFRGGGVPLALCWTLPWIVAPDIYLVSRLGYADHHILHILLAAWVVMLLLSDKEHRSSWRGALVGALCGIALWSSGSEMLLFCGAVAALALMETSAPDRTADLMRYWRLWWRVGAVTTTAAWLYEFWPAPFHEHTELISATHVLAWLLVGWLIERVERPAPMWVRLIEIPAAGAVWLFAVLLMRQFQFDQLHVFQDPFFQREMKLTIEFEPSVRSLLELPRVIWMRWSLLPLLALAPWLIHRTTPPQNRAKWLLGTAGFYGFLTLYQWRWGEMLTALLVIAAGYGVVVFVGRRRWIAPILMLVVLFPFSRQPWNVYRQIAAAPPNSLFSPCQEIFALESAADCIGSVETPPVVLAAWDQGPMLFGLGKARVLGSPYWSNIAGNIACCEMFTCTSVETFFVLAQRRNVTWLVLAAPDRLMKAISQSWILLYGIPPTAEELRSTVVWRIATGERFLPAAQPCENLRITGPGWRIFSVAKLKTLMIAPRSAAF